MEKRKNKNATAKRKDDKGRHLSSIIFIKREARKGRGIH